MRARLFFLVIAILAVAGFAAQNWPEINRRTSLTFGPLIMEAPLGMILLGALALLLLVYLASSAAHRAEYLREMRQHNKALQAQRDLAEKAEASRFNDLRQMLDGHLRDARQRDAVAGPELDKSLGQSQREIRNQLEQMNRSLASRLGEMEARLEARLDRAGMAGPAMRRTDAVRPEEVQASTSP